MSATRDGGGVLLEGASEIYRRHHGAVLGVRGLAGVNSARLKVVGVVFVLGHERVLLGSAKWIEVRRDEARQPQSVFRAPLGA